MRRGTLSGKRGLSEVIGYVLLISITMILSVIIYQWIKTYVPKEAIKCDDGVSIFVDNYNYDCNAKTLKLTLKNSGRFDIAGYFIHATTKLEQEIAVTDLSGVTSPHGTGGSVLYPPTGNPNSVSAGNIITDIFNLATLTQCIGIPTGQPCIFSIQLVPLRYQEIGGKNRPAACSNAKITQKISCTTGTPSSGAVCGDNQITGTETCDQGSGNVAVGDGCDASCHVETGWSCVNNPMPSVCTTVLFQYLASSTLPLNNGWTGNVCGLTSCSTYNDYIKSSISSPCSVDSSCGSYYMTTQRNWAAYKQISTIGYKNIILTYYSGKSDTGTLTVEYSINGGSSWSSVGTISSNGVWTKNSPLTLPSNAENVNDFRIRFWLSSSNNNYLGLFDSINITAQKR